MSSRASAEITWGFPLVHADYEEENETEEQAELREAYDTDWKKKQPVELIWHGVDGSSGFFAGVRASTQRASWCEEKAIAPLVVGEGWQAQLDAAAVLLGVEPKPGAWTLLVSYL